MINCLCMLDTNYYDCYDYHCICDQNRQYMIDMSTEYENNDNTEITRSNNNNDNNNSRDAEKVIVLVYYLSILASALHV